MEYQYTSWGGKVNLLQCCCWEIMVSFLWWDSCVGTCMELCSHCRENYIWQCRDLINVPVLRVCSIYLKRKKNKNQLGSRSGQDVSIKRRTHMIQVWGECNSCLQVALCNQHCLHLELVPSFALLLKGLPLLRKETQVSWNWKESKNWPIPRAWALITTPMAILHILCNAFFNVK